MLGPDATSPAPRGQVTSSSPGDPPPADPSPSEQDDPAVALRTWQETGHLVSDLHLPHLAAVRDARRFVAGRMRAIGLGDCADDAGLMVSELAANAVLHARTPFTVHLRPTLEGGARVEVHDHSALPPVYTAPSATAMSGRGLNLVATMATRWGSHPVPTSGGSAVPAEETSGKIVWFEVEAGDADAVPETSVEELLALWNDDPTTAPVPVVGPEHRASDPAPADGAATAGTPAPTGGGGSRATAPVPPPSPPGATGGPVTGSLGAFEQRVPVRRPSTGGGTITSAMPALSTLREVVIRDLPVGPLLAAKESMDDLLRELQLLLLALPGPAGASGPVPDPTTTTTGSLRHVPDADQLRAASRLDAAARGFEEGRRQVREQVTRAAARGEAAVTVRLLLPVAAARAAKEYREAVEDAETLTHSGQLLTVPSEAVSRSGVRERYLDEVVRQLEADDPA